MTSACPPQRWAARRQPERFAFNPETDTMIILPTLVCSCHAGIKQLMYASVSGGRTGPRRLPLSSGCA